MTIDAPETKVNLGSNLLNRWCIHTAVAQINIAISTDTSLMFTVRISLDLAYCMLKTGIHARKVQRRKPTGHRPIVSDIVVHTMDTNIKNAPYKTLSTNTDASIACSTENDISVGRDVVSLTHIH